MPALGAALVVIGAPLAVADHELKPGADAEQLFEIIASFVQRVKEAEPWPPCPRSCSTSSERAAVELREVPVPSPATRRSSCACAVGVCGSDVHQYHNTQSWTVERAGHPRPRVLRTRCAEVGAGVKGFAEGDLVTSETAAEIDETRR